MSEQTPSQPTSLKQALQAHYGEKSLSDEQRQRLLSLIHEGTEPSIVAPDEGEEAQETSLRPSWSFWGKSAISMSLVTACAVILLCTVRPDPQQTLLNKIAKEIIHNHLKQAPLKKASKPLRVAALRGRFRKLSFGLVDSPRLRGERWQLLSGKYCSVQGQLAVLLRYRDTRTGVIHSLYQTKLPGPLQSLSRTVTARFDNTPIKIWREGGVLFGMAGP